MLIVLVHNDSTGTEEAANYDVEVRINERTIWTGRVDGHHRANGWPRLLEKIALAGRGKKHRSKREVLLEDLKLRMDGKK